MTWREGHAPFTAACQEKNGQQRTCPQHEYPLIEDWDLRIPVDNAVITS